MSQFSLIKATFEEWKRKVDIIVQRRMGLSVDDLPDVCYRDMYEDGCTPSTAATKAIRAARE